MRGKRDTLLKKGCPPSPAPPFPFLKLLFFGGRARKERAARNAPRRVDVLDFLHPLSLDAGLCVPCAALFRFDGFSLAAIPAGCPTHPRAIVSPPASGKLPKVRLSLVAFFPSLLPSCASVAGSFPASPPLDSRRRSASVHAGVSSLRFAPSLFLSPPPPRNFRRPAFPPPGFVPCRSVFSPGTPSAVILS